MKLQTSFLGHTMRLWTYDNIKLNVFNCVLISDSTNASTNNDHISYTIRATRVIVTPKERY